MFSLSGQVAGGLQTALDEVMERRLREQMRRQQEQQQAAQLALQQRQQQGVEDDRTYRRDNDRRVIDLAEMERIDAKAQQATDRNISLDAANVMNMPGMTPQARADELNQSVFRNPKASSAPDMRRVIEGLTKRPDRVQYTYTNPNTGNQSTRFGNPDEMPAGGFDMGNEPQKPERGPAPDYEWVMRNGKPVQIRKGGAQMGDSPYEKPSAASTNAPDPVKARETLEKIEAAATQLRNAPGLGRLTGARIGNRDYALGVRDEPLEGSPAATAKAYYDSLKSLMTLENLGLLKGVLSDRDMQILQSAGSSLDTKMQDPAFVAELDTIIGKVSTQLGRPPAKPKSGGPSSRVDELLKKYGGG
jgi:hypothetical protein